jgi:hypothetical protein
LDFLILMRTRFLLFPFGDGSENGNCGGEHGGIAGGFIGVKATKGIGMGFEGPLNEGWDAALKEAHHCPAITSLVYLPPT